MYNDDYLFFKEEKLVDKLLSVFNIQSAQQLSPDKLITILGMLNLISLLNVSEDNNYPASNSSNNLKQESNSNEISELINTLKNNDNSNNNTSGLMSTLQSVLGDSNNNNQLNPELLFKLLNTFKDLRTKKEEPQEEAKKENLAVKSKPNEEE